MSDPFPNRQTRRIAVQLPLPLDQPYDYLLPDDLSLNPGDFVLVPLGTRERIGVVWTRSQEEGRAELPPEKLKYLLRSIDVPPLPLSCLKFAEWVARYNLIPLGLVVRMMMSAPLGFKPVKPRFGVKITDLKPDRMTPARARVLALAGNHLVWPKAALCEQAGVSTSVIDGLVKKGGLTSVVLPRSKFPVPDPELGSPTFSRSQEEAVTQLRAAFQGEAYSVTLLDGVTGSGKTDVYFEALAEALRADKQVLILLPEIALTSQFVARFEERFGCPPVEWHSGLSDHERGRIWRTVAEGEVRVVVGARSALFLPFTELGLIIVDEEHDQSFKQEERGIYQARDMSVVRASLSEIPIILASATPSLESYVNVRNKRYAHVKLPERYAESALPTIEAIDLRAHPAENGRWLSPLLISAIRKTLDERRQALLFLNRRGYAPLTLCRHCGWRFQCPQCTAWLVAHRFKTKLQCHHCGFSIFEPKKCPKCQKEGSLVPCGPGVERVAEDVTELFPKARTAILSSDLVPNIYRQRELLKSISEGHVDIIIGTQLVAKGHHFPNLDLVGVVDGDLGLGHADLRASERTYQLLHQVTGRAGRTSTVGRGFVQTHMPDHPVMKALTEGDREAFFEREIAARAHAGLPPFGRLVSLIISDKSRTTAHYYARTLALKAPPAKSIELLGPAEAPITLIRGRYRYRLLLKAPKEADVQAYLRHWLNVAPKTKGGLRLTVDIDPYNFL